jgi:hypothetical protein
MQIKNKLSLTEDLIVRNANQKTQPIRGGVYFLIWKDTIVYVGRSEDMSRRIKMHIRNNKLKFTKYFLLFLGKDEIKDIKAIERHYIDKFKPKWNITFNSDNVYFDEAIGLMRPIKGVKSLVVSDGKTHYGNGSSLFGWDSLSFCLRRVDSVKLSTDFNKVDCPHCIKRYEKLKVEAGEIVRVKAASRD